MNQTEAFLHPDVNVFDIINTSSKTYYVKTYFKADETDQQFQERHRKNEQFADKLKKKQSPADLY